MITCTPVKHNDDALFLIHEDNSLRPIAVLTRVEAQLIAVVINRYLYPSVNVKDFLTVQEAIDKIKVLGGGYVYFPKGIYYTDVTPTAGEGNDNVSDKR